MGKTKYIINTGGLSVGNHEFEFEVTEAFFKEQETIELERAKVNVKALLIKQNNVFQLHFTIEGTVAADCDRCLKEFDFPIYGEESLAVKQGNPDESNDEVLMINAGETQLDVTQNIYEYILTAIPARKVPCEIDKKKFKCDSQMLDKLNDNLTINESSEDNPLWNKLNNIKKE